MPTTTTTSTQDSPSISPWLTVGQCLSRLFGMVLAHEIRAAAAAPATAIPHALQVSMPSTWNCAEVFREPATKTDGLATTTDCVQGGARVQLHPTFDCASVSTKLAQAICASLQTYGGYVMDNNGSTAMGFFAQHRLSWPTGDADYAAAGMTSDYRDLGLPLSRLRVLAWWDGSWDDRAGSHARSAVRTSLMLTRSHRGSCERWGYCETW